MASDDDIRALAAVQVGTDLLGDINAQRTLLNNALVAVQAFNDVVGVGSGPPPAGTPAGRLIYVDQDEPAIYLRSAGGDWTPGLAFMGRVSTGAASLDFAALGNLFLA